MVLVRPRLQALNLQCSNSAKMKTNVTMTSRGVITVPAAPALFPGVRMPLGTTLASRSASTTSRCAARAASPPGGSGATGTGGQVIAVGKRLSDRLYIVYEQGPFVAPNALRIEYALSRNITIRAEAGLVSGVGIYDRRSFD